MQKHPSSVADWGDRPGDKEAAEISSFLRKPFDLAKQAGFEKARLRTMGASLGCRESRKILGDYDLIGDDVLHQARFEDSIGIFPEFLDGNRIAIMPSTGRYFHVPYRITLPQRVENLGVAGRCVAGDKVSHVQRVLAAQGVRLA